MPRCLIIDGYNAISKIKKLNAKKDSSLEAARMSLVKILMDFMARKRRFDKIVIVFDSKEKTTGITKDLYQDIEVVFATHDRDADSVIVDMLRAKKSSDKISVSSDDNFVRNHARVYGSEALSIKELENIILLKKGVFRSKIKEKDFQYDKVRVINEELKKHWGLK